jgi:peptide/nickel transport system permease protein
MSAPAVSVTAPGATRASRGLWGDALRRLLRNRPAIVGLVCVAIFIGAAILAPVIAPYGPLEGTLAHRYQPTSGTHLLGTDTQGRDELTRILYGAQVSLQVGVIAVLMALLMGGIIGALAGGIGGRIDAVLMRVVDVLLAIPGILLAIGIIAWLDRGMFQLIDGLAIT